MQDNTRTTETKQFPGMPKKKEKKGAQKNTENGGGTLVPPEGRVPTVVFGKEVNTSREAEKGGTKREKT